VAKIDIYQAMATLRAVRRLRPEPIPDEVLARVIEAATWAPTGGNAQPWRVIAVSEAEIKERLAGLYAERWSAYAAHHRTLIEDAPARAKEKARRMLAAGDYLATHFAETPVVLVFCFDPRRMAITDAELGRVSVVGGASVYPAVQNLLLACRAEGLGCVLTTLLCQVEPQVRELLHIPEPWATAAAIPVGWPVLAGHGPVSRRPVAKMAFAERWGEPWTMPGESSS
jgi:nitroreductase